MQTVLTKLSLLTLLTTASIGTAFASDTPVCPSVTGGNITFAAPQDTGGWSAFRLPPGTSSYSIWQGLVIIIKDADVTNENEAKVRGKEILDSSWWGPYAAEKIDQENGTYFYRCNYELASPYGGRGDRMGLVSFDFINNGVANKSLPLRNNADAANSGSDLEGILKKANHKEN